LRLASRAIEMLGLQALTIMEWLGPELELRRAALNDTGDDIVVSDGATGVRMIAEP
jgi:hypothetical protein